MIRIPLVAGTLGLLLAVTLPAPARAHDTGFNAGFGYGGVHHDHRYHKRFHRTWGHHRSHGGWKHGHHHRHGKVRVQSPPVVIRQPSVVVRQAPTAAYCREYTATAVIGGRPVPTYGTACLQPDGSWRIVSQAIQ